MTLYPSDTLPQHDEADEPAYTQEKEVALTGILEEAEAAFEHHRDGDARRFLGDRQAGKEQFSGN